MPWTEFVTFDDLGGLLGDPLIPVLRNAKKFIGMTLCDLYCNHREWLLAGAGIATVASDGAVGVGMGLMIANLARTCSCANEPPSVVPPNGYGSGFKISGGQCPCVQYRMFVSIVTYPPSVPTGIVGTFNVGVYKGAISNIRTGGVPGTVNGFRSLFANTRGDSNTFCLPSPQQTLLSENENGFGGITGVNLVRVDGQPDDCGNESPYVPPVPPPSVFNRKFPINLPSPEFPNGLHIPVVLTPVFINGSIPLIFDFSGAKFAVNFDGVFKFQPTFNFSYKPTVNKFPKDVPPPKGGGGGFDGLPVDDVPPKKEEEPEEEGVNTDVEIISAAESGAAVVRGSIIQVTMFLIEDPLKSKIQFGAELEDNYYYAGWGQFGLDGIYQDKRRLGFAAMKLKPTELATEFRFTGTRGAKWRAVILFKI